MDTDKPHCPFDWNGWGIPAEPESEVRQALPPAPLLLFQLDDVVPIGDSQR